MTDKRTYGRGAGERKYHPIPMVKNRRRTPSRLYESGHARYPVSGIYATEEPPVSDSQNPQ